MGATRLLHQNSANRAVLPMGNFCCDPAHVRQKINNCMWEFVPTEGASQEITANLESEARLAAAELGLDPGLGILHRDTPNRDSLACDLMEPVRPLVDAYVFDWLSRGPIRRGWFFEQADGNCRLMAACAAQLAETAATWRKAVAPYVERAATIFWQGRAKKSRFALPTRLTQTSHSLAKAGNVIAQVPGVPKTLPRCPLCGGAVTVGSTFCAKCVPDVNRENMLVQVKLGRIATHSAIAEARRAATHAKHVEALRKWNPSELPAWLDEDFYRCRILPTLSKRPRGVGNSKPASSRFESRQWSYPVLEAPWTLPRRRPEYLRVGRTTVAGDTAHIGGRSGSSPVRKQAPARVIRARQFCSSRRCAQPAA